MKVRTLRKMAKVAIFAPLGVVAVGAVLQFLFHVSWALDAGLSVGLGLWLARLPLEARLRHLKGIREVLLARRQERNKRNFIREVEAAINTGALKDELLWLLEEVDSDYFQPSQEEQHEVEGEIESYKLDEMEYSTAVRLIRNLKYDEV